MMYEHEHKNIPLTFTCIVASLFGCFCRELLSNSVYIFDRQSLKMSIRKSEFMTKSTVLVNVRNLIQSIKNFTDFALIGFH